MWPVKHIVPLIALWLILDYRFYSYLHPAAYFAAALIIVVVGLWLARRNRFDDVRLHLPKLDDWRVAGLVLIALLVVLIPLGLVLDFIRFTPSWGRLQRTAIEAIFIFFFIALPEEIIFRGLIQKTLQALSGNAVLALTIASILFGLAHLHKRADFPNWRYALLAAIAGLGYGIAFQRRGLVASSLAHTLVSVIWRLFFR